MSSEPRRRSGVEAGGGRRGRGGASARPPRPRRAAREAAEAEARRQRDAEVARLRALRARMTTLAVDVYNSGNRDVLATLTEEEKVYFNRAQTAHRRERHDALKQLMAQIDAGVAPADAVDRLSIGDRTVIRSLAIDTAMARVRAQKNGSANGVEIHDAVIDLYFQTLTLIGSLLKHVTTVFADFHANNPSYGPFISIEKSHDKGLNTYGFDAFGQWAFGYYSFYVRITASSPKPTWRLEVSETPLQATTRTNSSRAKEIVNRAPGSTDFPKTLLVRNSGTLLWH